MKAHSKVMVGSTEAPALRATSGAGARSRCGVCGCTAVAVDEVAVDGGMLLGECPRCAHRWTLRLRDPDEVRRARRVRRSPRESARAA